MADHDHDHDRPLASHPDKPVNEQREALDAGHFKGDMPTRDERLDINIDESFPASDPPAITQPRTSNDPPPGGKYD